MQKAAKQAVGKTKEYVTKAADIAMQAAKDSKQCDNRACRNNDEFLHRDVSEI